MKENGYAVLNADDFRLNPKLFENIVHSTEKITHCNEEYCKIGLNTVKDRYKTNVHEYVEACHELQHIVLETLLKPFHEEMNLVVE